VRDRQFADGAASTRERAAHGFVHEPVNVPVCPSKPGLFDTTTFSVVATVPACIFAPLCGVSVSVALTGDMS
jgi:hypothetical protein